MKVGETKSVSIEGLVVAQAAITEIDTENQVVTVIIPATEAKLSYTTQLSAPPAPDSPVSLNDNAHVLLGTENAAPGGEPALVSSDPTPADAPRPAGVPGAAQVGTESTNNSSATTEANVIPASPVEPTGFDSPAHAAVQSGAVETTDLGQGELPGEDPSA